MLFVKFLVGALVLSGCGSNIEATTSSPPTAVVSSESTVPSALTSTAPTTNPMRSLSVKEVVETSPMGLVEMRGSFIDGGSGALLCDTLAESFPPQCGGRWIVLLNHESLDLELTTQGSVRWAEQTVFVVGHKLGERFVVGDSPAINDPSAKDRLVIDAFVAQARARPLDPSASLPIAADGVWLGLSGDLLVQRTKDQLRDPQEWFVDKEAFRGWVGPFSAQAFLAELRPTELLLGPHNHCASVPAAQPPETSEMRHLSISPTDITSCLEWWTVDFYVNPDGLVEAITLDLWEP